jgi:hypothetical protein
MSTTAYNLHNLLQAEFEVYSIFFLDHINEVVDPNNFGNCFSTSMISNRYLFFILNKLGISIFKIRSVLMALKIRWFLFKKSFSPDLIILNVPEFFFLTKLIFLNKRIILIVSGLTPFESFCIEEGDACNLLDTPPSPRVKERVKDYIFSTSSNTKLIFNSILTQKIYSHFGIYNGRSEVFFFNLVNKLQASTKDFKDRNFDLAFIVSRQNRNIKNTELALSLFNYFPSSKKIVIGSGKNIFENCPNTECITFLPQNEIYTILNDVKVLIVTSYFDSSPGVQSEAIVSGANILVSKNIGWNDVMQTESVVNDYFNINEWVEKISYLINNKVDNVKFKFILSNSVNSIKNFINESLIK